jgi:hypothetical protein
MHTRPPLTHEQTIEIESSVISYLESHPNARDTLEGIVTWWLPLQRYVEAKLLIGQVIEGLVQDGHLSRESLPDGSHLYSLKHRPN